MSTEQEVQSEVVSVEDVARVMMQLAEGTAANFVVYKTALQNVITHVNQHNERLQRIEEFLSVKH